MTSTDAHDVTQAPAHQGIVHVYAAELRRLWAAGGLRTSAIVVSILGLVGGGLALLVLMLIADEVSDLHMTVPIELAGTITTLGMCLVTVIAVCRDNTGFVSFSLLYTPRRGRLLWARMLAYATVSVTVTVVVLLTVTIAVVSFAHVLPLTLVCAGFIFCACTSACVTVACVALATIVERLAGALLILIGVMFILPLVIGVFGGMLPDWTQPSVKAVVDGMPTSLLFTAVSLSTLKEIGATANIIAGLGLVIWGAATGTAAAAIFGRRDR